jgi:hypothetical protein
VACLLSALLPGPATGSDGRVVITASVFLSPLEVQASAPCEITTGTIFTVKAIIRNNGDLHIRRVTAAIYLPTNLELAVSKAETTRGTVPAHKDAVASWKVRALEEGNYIIMVLASGIYAGTVVTEQDVALATVG